MENGRRTRWCLPMIVAAAIVLGCGGGEERRPGDGAGGIGGEGGVGPGGTGGEGGTGGIGGAGGETPAEACANALDDDGDGATDCADPDCADDAACACGNGRRDAGEDCDGDDLGGATCADLGHGSGVLACDETCRFDDARCLPAEDCGNGTDDDEDGAIDCADEDCDVAPGCNACGDERADRLEACDGADLRGETCESRGFPLGGMLLCVECSFWTDACYRPEVCDNLADDDGDGLLDCQDAVDCAADPGCEPGAYCRSAIPLLRPETSAIWSGSTADGADRFAGSCTGSGGPERVFVTVPGSFEDRGYLHVELLSDADLGLHVRGVCDLPETELACADDAGAGTAEIATPFVTGDQLVAIVVDGKDAAAAGPFTLKARFEKCGNASVIPPETCDPPDGERCSDTCQRLEACGNGADDDDDLLFDCEDPDCLGHFACVPGTGLPGEPCGAATDCAAASGDDPVCRDEAGTGNPGGACGESCDLVSGSCPAGSVCLDAGRGNGRGVCTRRCTTSAECRAAYACATVGGTSVCVPDCTDDLECPVVGHCDGATGRCTAPEVCDNVRDDDGDGAVDCLDPECAAAAACTAPEPRCHDLQDDDGDGLVDCRDTGCQASGACVPGAGAVGSPCTGPGACASIAGADPVCLDQATFGLPGGACGELCTLSAPDCPAGSYCVGRDAILGRPVPALDTGVCVKTCATAAECAPGLGCKAVDPRWLTRGCWLVEDCGNGADDDRDGAVDCADPECRTAPACQSFGSCGIPTPIQAGVTHGTTAGGTSNHSAAHTSWQCFDVGNGYPERIFRYVPGLPGQVGTVSVRLDSPTNHGVYVRATCDVETSELGCMELDPFGGTPEAIDVRAVRGDASLFLFVDAASPGAEGPFTLQVSYKPWVCGDGILDDDEYCDDGDLTPATPGCNSSCEIFETEPNDGMATADPYFHPISGWTGGILPAGDEDWVWFDVAQAPAVVTAMTRSIRYAGCWPPSSDALADVDSVLDLVDGLGNVLATNDNRPGYFPPNFCSYIRHQVAVPGRYYVRVRGHTDGAPPGVNWAAFLYGLDITVEPGADP